MNDLIELLRAMASKKGEVDNPRELYLDMATIRPDGDCDIIQIEWLSDPATSRPLTPPWSFKPARVMERHPPPPPPPPATGGEPDVVTDASLE